VLDHLLERAMLGRDHRQQLLDRLLLGHGGGQHEVDAEGLAADALADPADVGGDLVGRVQRLAQHREAARVDHGDGDVLAVGEGDDRVFDAELVAQRRVQRTVHLRVTPVGWGGRRHAPGGGFASEPVKA
jgi:hypothetical protein